MSVPGVRIPYPPQNYLLEDKQYNELGEGSNPVTYSNNSYFKFI